MSKKFPHLLSPIKIGNVVLKNRMTTPLARPHFVQGSERYPTEAMITHYANKAKNGASLVLVGPLEQYSNNQKLTVIEEKYFGFGGGGYARHRVKTEGGMGGAIASDIESYLSQLTEAVHFYDAKVSMAYGVSMPAKYMPKMGEPGSGPPMMTVDIPEDVLDQMATEYAHNAALLKDLGFDGVMPGIMGVGKDLAGRAWFANLVADRIKQMCGRDFLTSLMTNTRYPPYKDGMSLEETIEFAKLLSGHFDMLEVRPSAGDPKHPTGYNPERTPFLYISEAIKKSGAGIAVVTNGGYLDLGICEDVIASGKADLIGMARAFISNPDYGIKAYEGRGDDVVPCLRCNKCHVNTYSAPFASICSVNPTWGFEHKIERMVAPPTPKKRVAVVGGGPGGMEAALVMTGRGHDVTLYEKSDALGGTLKASSIASFKWPLKAFKNFLAYQLKKQGVKVHLNTEATPEMLKKEKYDAVFVAIGAEPIVPDIPGVKSKNVVYAKDVYGNESALAENVVVIGGGETGVETGMYLAQNGHKVTVIEAGDMLAPKAPGTHFYSMFKEAWEALPDFKSILNARVTGIKAGKVTYVGADGKEQSIAAGSVVVAAGFTTRIDSALEFAGAAERFFMVGDCKKVGCVQTTMRSSYSTACMI